MLTQLIDLVLRLDTRKRKQSSRPSSAPKNRIHDSAPKVGRFETDLPTFR